jgi:anti-sigma factor RsiW
MREIDVPTCGRENDLVGFLYGELNEVESLAFERHLNDCATCHTELQGFGAVRESVVAWRNESLARVGLPVQVADSAPTVAAPAGRSAIAALREFFNLSPLWMKGAVAFGAILFCVFAGLAVARLQNKQPPTAVINPPTHSQSTEEVNALVDRRVKEELKRIKDAEQPTSPPITAQNLAPTNPRERIAHRPNVETTLNHSARRPLSKTEREQLAADLRLVTAKSENDLNLLGDTINQ